MMLKSVGTYVSVFFLLFVIFICSASSASNDKDSVTLYGEVNDNSAVIIINKLHYFNKSKTTKPIYFYIDSGGGSVFAGTKIIDAMLASNRPIYTVDVGMAASMAAYIHSYGTKRYMFPHAILMFHNASTAYSNESVDKLSSRLIMLNSIMHSLDSNVVKRSGIVTMEYLRTHEANEWWLLSGDAVDKHLTDAIISMDNYPIALSNNSSE